MLSQRPMIMADRALLSNDIINQLLNLYFRRGTFSFLTETPAKRPTRAPCAGAPLVTGLPARGGAACCCASVCLATTSPIPRSCCSNIMFRASNARRRSSIPNATFRAFPSSTAARRSALRCSLVALRSPKYLYMLVSERKMDCFEIRFFFGGEHYIIGWVLAQSTLLSMHG
ncbi:hypothetical protein BDB00DRAFT_858547, partial [Zychaea mexicana]|uniref:uncharacterized protein n=1 Tax=Zychaea mexicana TaxID=64656 RepID=UPI0022FEB76D